MSRGGRREGAGRKSRWESGCSFSETTVIRVPKVLRNKLLEVAHKLDAEEKIFLDSELSIRDQRYLDELKKRARILLYDESLVRYKDRSPVKRILSSLFGVDKSYFD